MLDGIADLGPFRLVGLGAFDLCTGLADSQLALSIEDRRARLLETTIDGVRARFGTEAVQRASELVADHGVGVASNLDFLDDGERGS